MSSPIENPLSVWSGLEEMQNKLAGNIARDLWSKHKPVRRLFGLLWRIGVAHKFLFLGGCAAMGAGWVRGAVREALMERIEANRDEIARKKRLKGTRRNFAGPLKQACSDADRLISSVLAPPGHDYYHEFFPDKPEMSLYGSIYFFCRVGYHRRLLWEQTKYELITHNDSWQWIMERMLQALDCSITWKEASVSEYVRLFHWMPHDASEARHDHIKAYVNCPILRASFAWCFPKKYPLRLSGLDRDVLSDIMEQNPSARGQPGRTPSCISYIDFAQEMKAALGSLSADDSNHPWAAYMMPVWSDFVCFVSLQMRMMHERGTMTQMEFLQAMQMRVRMRAFQKMQETLVQILNLPVDAWSGSFQRMQRLMFWRSRKDKAQAAIIPQKYLRLLPPATQRDIIHLSLDDQATWEAYMRLRCRTAVLWEIVRTATWCRCFPKLMVAQEQKALEGSAGQPAGAE